MLKTRQTCRVCNSTLYDIFDLGEFRIVGYNEDKMTRKVPLCLTRCDPVQDENACGLVQLRHTTPSQFLYDEYYYMSGMNLTMTTHLHDVASLVTSAAGAEKDDIIIDIGCNDGTYLKWFSERGFSNLYGFDPAKNMAQYSRTTGANITEDYFTYGNFVSACGDIKAKIISSIAMFYDLEYPHDFVRSIAMSLAPDGVWVLELAYLPKTLSQNSFDTICHEHIEYYCLHTLTFLLQKYNLEVIDVYENDINGGSFQVYVSHKGKRKISEDAYGRISDMKSQEFEAELDTVQPYNNFVDRVEDNKLKLLDFLRDAKEQNKKVYCYGASTKGAITLQYCGITNKDILGCADRNPDKWGKVMSGTNIPIISEELARSDNPDYFLVLPWHFMPEFIKREREFLNNGGLFVKPMPVFEIIGKQT